MSQKNHQHSFFRSAKATPIIELPIDSDDELISDEDLFDSDFNITDSDDDEEASSSKEESDSEDDVPLSTIAKKTNPHLWRKNQDNYLAGSPPPFLGIHDSFVNGDTPFSYFKFFLEDEILKAITEETNIYALQQGKEYFRLTVSELKVFLGINILMTYIKYPRVRMYWSSEKGLRVDLIANNMSVNRFEDIRRHLHFTNNCQIPSDNTDRLIRIRPILTYLHKRFHDALSPEEFMAIDEMVVPFKGRSGLKQYIKNKPKKWGFKIWALANSSGYIYCFEVYQGSSQGAQASKEFGPIGDMVLRITHAMKNLNIKLFMDNLFNSMNLILKLKSEAIFVVGTARINRFNEGVRYLEPIEKLKKEGRGSSSVATCSDNVTLLRWMDNNAVHLVSTYVGLNPMDKAIRWDKRKKEHVEVDRPFAVQLYNKYMGGIDMADRMIAHYPHNLKCKRWYLRIFFHLLNVVIGNSWVLFKRDHGNISLLEFKAYLATALIQIGIAEQLKPNKGRPSGSSPRMVPVKKKTSHHPIIPEIQFDGTDHFPGKNNCKSAPRCHAKDCRRRTRYFCRKCNVPICPECMMSFHTKI